MSSTIVSAMALLICTTLPFISLVVLTAFSNSVSVWDIISLGLLQSPLIPSTARLRLASSTICLPKKVCTYSIFLLFLVLVLVRCLCLLFKGCYQYRVWELTRFILRCWYLHVHGPTRLAGTDEGYLLLWNMSYVQALLFIFVLISCSSCKLISKSNFVPIINIPRLYPLSSSACVHVNINILE